MPLESNKDIIKRGIELSSSISRETIFERLKRIYELGYERNYFYHVNANLFDKDNESDREILKRMQKSFLSSRFPNQHVPLNLFDMENEEERSLFKQALISKYRDGIKLYFDVTLNGV